MVNVKVFEPIAVDDDIICADTLICGGDAKEEVMLND
jgi:hypothetical protein